MSSVNNISRHNERQNKQYGNPHIDTDHSHENFHFKKPVEASYESEFERIKKQEQLLGNIRRTGKKQSNAVCEFIITSDSAFFVGKSKKEIREFFADCYDFVKQKCGEPYILSAVVHMDEKTPHMHASYIPVVDGQDRKGNPCKRVNCSQFWAGYNSYGQLQDDFHAFITSRGHVLERGEIGSRKEHLTLLELKSQTLEKEIAGIEGKMQESKGQFSALEKKLGSMQGVILSKKKLDSLRPEPGMMGSVKGVSLVDIESLKKTATEYFILNEKMRELSVKYVNLKSKVPTEAEKLETAQKLAKLHQLEQDKGRMEQVLKAHNISIEQNNEIEKEYR